MSYMKPLGRFKQTQCKRKDEILHADFDDYVSMLTTTRTPDLPGGKQFAVKARMCIMRAGAAASRLVVSTTVEWTDETFFNCEC